MTTRFAILFWKDEVIFLHKKKKKARVLMCKYIDKIVGQSSTGAVLPEA